MSTINPLMPNDHYSGRTAPLTSKRFILYIYPTDRGTEYFKHSIHSPFFFSSKCCLFRNSNVFGSYFIHILCTGCVQCLKKKEAPLLRQFSVEKITQLLLTSHVNSMFVTTCGVKQPSTQLAVTIFSLLHYKTCGVETPQAALQTDSCNTSRGIHTCRRPLLA